MKRFYELATVVASPAGYAIALDDRPVKTPGKADLLMPTKALADAVAAEWQAQGEDIDTATMPITTLANTALDRVKPRFEAVADAIANFAGTDMLCYRAEEPAELVAQQNTIWNPYLDWARETLNAPLVTTNGIMPIAQDQASLAAISAAVNSHCAFELTALHEFTGGFGSVVLGLAYMHGFQPFDVIWQASLVDQSHQESAWGKDYEAIEKTENLLRDLQVACEFLAHVRTS